MQVFQANYWSRTFGDYRDSLIESAIYRKMDINPSKSMFEWIKLKIILLVDRIFSALSSSYRNRYGQINNEIKKRLEEESKAKPETKTVENIAKQASIIKDNPVEKPAKALIKPKETAIEENKSEQNIEKSEIKKSNDLYNATPTGSSPKENDALKIQEKALTNSETSNTPLNPPQPQTIGSSISEQHSGDFPQSSHSVGNTNNASPASRLIPFSEEFLAPFELPDHPTPPLFQTDPFGLSDLMTSPLPYDTFRQPEPLFSEDEMSQFDVPPRISETPDNMPSEEVMDKVTGLIGLNLSEEDICFVLKDDHGINKEQALQIIKLSNS